MLAAYLLWPVLFGTCLVLTAFVIGGDHVALGFNAIYLGLALSLWWLERRLPHDAAWLADDGQMPADLAHTLVSKGMVQTMVFMAALIGLGDGLNAGSQWPTQWPMPAQVIAGLVLMEFGLYWAHRSAHRWPPIWRFHAIHHSVRRLWFFNTGRFHIVDTLWRLVLGLPLLWLAGAPGEVIQWVSAITAYIGLLTHCNVDMRCGIFNRLFNTPQLHRWHHSLRPDEGDRNFGENLVLFDQLFGTYYYDRHRRAPAEIGIREPMPAGFFGQVLQPFRRNGSPT